jgi:hypothetical protein
MVPPGKIYTYRPLPLLPTKILLPPSTVSSEKYPYSIIHHLFQMEKILTSSIATPETKILHHVPPLLFVENTTTFSMH